jgi:hypothetical protein
MSVLVTPRLIKKTLRCLNRLEEFVLREMENFLTDLDRKHPLRIAVSSIQDLGVNEWDTGDGEGDQLCFGLLLFGGFITFLCLVFSL